MILDAVYGLPVAGRAENGCNRAETISRLLLVVNEPEAARVSLAIRAPLSVPKWFADHSAVARPGTKLACLQRFAGRESRRGSTTLCPAARAQYSRPDMSPRKPRRVEPELGDGAPMGVDPRDVQFHARRMRQAKEVGPLGKLFRFGAVALVLVGAFLIYWNFDTLSRLRFDFSALTGRDPAPSTEVAGEAGTQIEGRNPVAGVSVPTSLPGEEPQTAEPPAESPGAAAPAPTVAAATEPRAETNRALPTVTVDEPPAPAPPPREPEPPPGPETFGFGSSTLNVSESEASAAVLVLREGDRRRPSSITWWTVDGTARAGSDFADLGKSVLRFAASEQNRAIYVPIVGDRAVEGSENFYIHIAAGDSAETLARIEVVIVDDD
jgi:hypothetical protein